MKKSIQLKTTVILLILLFSVRISLSQTKKQEPPVKVQLPDSYYKGIEEKKKYAESHKPGSINTTTATTFYSNKTTNQEIASPDVRAQRMLNTASVPSDFPKYKSYSMTEKEFETLVANWFKANPSFRKINK
jgi:hypothetical protein